MESLKVRTEITASLHPAVIENIDNFSIYEGYLRGAREAFHTAYKELGAIHDARRAAASNPTLNESAQLIAVADFAEKRQTVITRKFDAVHENLTSAVKMVEATLSEPLKISTQSAIYAEIRAHAKSLSDKERSSFITGALDSGDMQTLTAVLGAPGYLSGLSEPVRAARTRQLHEKQNPDLVKRLDATSRALELLHNYSGLIFTEVIKAVGADWTHVNRIRGAKERAESAFRD